MTPEVATVAPAWWTVGRALAAAAEGRPWPISGDHTTRAQAATATWPAVCITARAG